MKDHPMFLPAVILANTAALINSVYQWAELGLRLAVLFATALISILTLWREYKRHQQRRARREPRRLSSHLPALIAVVVLFVLFLPGCSFLSSTAYDPESGYPSGRVRVYTLFDGQSSLTKLRQSKAGTVIGSLNESSSGTNANSLVVDVVSAAIKAAK